MLASQDHETDVDSVQTGSLIWNYFDIDVVQSTLGGAKDITCNLLCHWLLFNFSFCTYIWLSFSWKKKSPYIIACLPKSQVNYSWYALFKLAQKVHNK